MEHRSDAIAYARRAAPELTLAEAERYLGWYANARTLHLGDEEREAITFLFELARQKNLIPQTHALEIV